MTVRAEKAEIERRAWKIIQSLEEFDWHTLSEPGIPEWRIKDILRAWEREGRIVISRVDGRRKWFRLPADVDATRRAEVGGTPHGNMWRTIRREKDVSALDVAAHSTSSTVSVTEEEAQRYCTQLMKAGYLKVTVKAVVGQRAARYRLTDDTGPEAPRPRRITGIVDPNSRTFRPLDEALR